MHVVRRIAALAGLLLAAGVWAGAASAAGEPVNVDPPSADGRPQAGHTLTADVGTWRNSPTSYAYQWKLCSSSGGGCTDILGETASTYVVGLADIGLTLAVEVTATNAQGDVAATSAATPIVSDKLLETARVLVHYQTDLDSGAAITQTQAGDIAAAAERTLTLLAADGFPAPVADGTLGGDSRVDIYIADIPLPGVYGYAVPEAGGRGHIVIDAEDPATIAALGTIAHEVFHLVQFGIWLPSLTRDYWLLEGSAEWMAYRVDPTHQGGTVQLGDWDMALDCRDPTFGVQCDLTGAYKNNGYSRWPFFQYLTERWGPASVRTIFERGATAGNAVEAVRQTVAEKGTTLADVYTDWSVANMTAGYSFAALRGILPPTYGAPLATGTIASLNVDAKAGAAVVTSGAIESRVVPVNHLSTRYVAFRRGSSDLGDGPCYAATLTIKVELPDGVGARPFYWWSQRNDEGANKEAATPLAISGSTATIAVPWDTCDWGSTYGYLALPNATVDRDGQLFSVSGTIAIDRSRETTATLPPAGVSMPGAVVDVESVEAPPRIEVFGPQLIRLSGSAKVLRLIVSSSGSGKLRAALGSTVLGSAALRAGSNDVRFRLRPAATKTLRRTAAASAVLRLTPLSATGSAGKSVVRRVRVEGATGAAKAAKAKKRQQTAAVSRRR